MSNCRKRCAVVFFFFLLFVSYVQAEAQISANRLLELRAKYDWGSIYLSYGTIPDIIQILEDRNRLERIKAAFNCSPPASMISFLSRYRDPSQRKSILLFQLNFSAKDPIAGFLTGTDLNGTINKAPMSSPEVLAAANWVDMYLTRGAEVAQMTYIITTGKVSLNDSWIAIGKLHANPFVSEYQMSSLLIAFRHNQAQREAEVESLRIKNPRLHETLKRFAAQYDARTTSFIQEFFKENVKAYQDRQPGTQAHVDRENLKRPGSSQNRIPPRPDLYEYGYAMKEHQLRLGIVADYEKLLKDETATKVPPTKSP